MLVPVAPNIYSRVLQKNLSICLLLSTLPSLLVSRIFEFLNHESTLRTLFKVCGNMIISLSSLFPHELQCIVILGHPMPLSMHASYTSELLSKKLKAFLIELTSSSICHKTSWQSPSYASPKLSPTDSLKILSIAVILTF